MDEDVKKKLISFYEWFNSNEEEIKENVINFLKGKFRLALPEDGTELLLNALKAVTELMVKKEHKDDEIVRIISSCGIEGHVSKYIFEYSKTLAQKHSDARLVNKISESKLHDVCSFIIKYSITNTIILTK